MITVANYEKLRGLPIPAPQTTPPDPPAPLPEPVFVLGLEKFNDGGEGIFTWDEKSTEEDNGGTILAPNPEIPKGRWKRVIEEKVNVQWFGAVPDCYKGHDQFCAVPSGLKDSTIPIQKAIDFCIAYGYDLYFPAGRRDAYGVHGEYLVTNTLKIVGPFGSNSVLPLGCNSKNKYCSINIYAEVNATITGYILDKVSPILLFEGCKQGKIENLTIQGCGYLPLAGIQLVAEPQKEDGKNITSYLNSEGMELYNVKIYNCRHGVYAERAETMNRMVFNRCVFVANLIAGFYLKSVNAPEATGFAGSAPITFTNTIINGNGIPDFLVYKPEVKDERGVVIKSAYYPPKYENITVLNDEDKYGYQLYADGFGNLSYFGGQISGHGGAAMLSLVSLENGGGVNFSGVDIEDIHNPVTEGGDSLYDTKKFEKGYDTDFGSLGGSAINVRNVSDFNLIQSHVYNINTQSVFKFAGRCYDVNIELMDIYKEYSASGNYKYSVDVVKSNFGDFLDPGTWENEDSPNHPMNVLTRLHYKGPKDKLSTAAFNALDRSDLQVLTSIKGPIVPGNLNSIFTHSPIPFPFLGSSYVVDYNGPGEYDDLLNPGPYYTPIHENGALYIEKDIVFGNVFHAIVECTQNFNRSGLFFMQQINEDGYVTSNKSVSLQGNGKIGHQSNIKNTSFTYYTYLTQKLDPETVKVRYGFINNNAINAGYIPNDITVKGITAYIDYHNPVQKRRPVDTDF